MWSRSVQKPDQGRPQIDEKLIPEAQGVPGVSREVSGVPAGPNKSQTKKTQQQRPRGVAAPAAKFAAVAPLQTLYTRGRGPRDSIVCALSLHPRYRFRSGAGLHLHVVPARGYLGNSFISRKGYGLAYAGLRISLIEIAPRRC